MATRREALFGAVSVTLASMGFRPNAQATPAQVPLRQRVSFGAFAANEPWPSIDPHLALEQLVVASLPTLSWFQSWDNQWLDEQAASAGRRPLMIAWEPWHDDRSPVDATSVLDGRWDPYLARFLTGAKSYPGEVTIRLAHEMNGDWYPWGGNSAQYVDVWRHVVALGRRVAPHVRWMWCVNAFDVGPPAEAYWPGRGWVDLVGIDGYNGYGPWTSFGDLFTPMHDRLRRLTSVPQWVAEVGCAEGTTGAKAAWLTGLFAEPGLPALERVVFFHQNKEHDWRLNSSESALAAARAGLSETGQA